MRVGLIVPVVWGDISVWREPGADEVPVFESSQVTDPRSLPDSYVVIWRSGVDVMNMEDYDLLHAFFIAKPISPEATSGPETDKRSLLKSLDGVFTTTYHNCPDIYVDNHESIDHTHFQVREWIGDKTTVSTPDTKPKSFLKREDFVFDSQWEWTFGVRDGHDSFRCYRVGYVITVDCRLRPEPSGDVVTEFPVWVDVEGMSACCEVFKTEQEAFRFAYDNLNCIRSIRPHIHTNGVEVGKLVYLRETDIRASNLLEGCFIYPLEGPPLWMQATVIRHEKLSTPEEPVYVLI